MMMGKVIAEVLNEIEEDEVKVRVGRISKELQAEIQANNEAHRAEHDAIKAKIDAFIEEVTKGHSCDGYNELRAELWERTYDELGLTEAERGLRYTMESGSRVVYRLDDVEENENEFIQ